MVVAPTLAAQTSATADSGLTAGPAKAPQAIQDGKTIDFSSGQPQVHSTPEDQAAMAAALKEMEEAAKDVTFPADAKK